MAFMRHKTPLVPTSPRFISSWATTGSREFRQRVINSGRYTLDEDLDRFETDVINPETVFGIVSMPNDFRSSWFRDNLRSTTTPARNWPSAKTLPSS